MHRSSVRLGLGSMAEAAAAEKCGALFVIAVLVELCFCARVNISPHGSPICIQSETSSILCAIDQLLLSRGPVATQLFVILKG